MSRFKTKRNSCFDRFDNNLIFVTLKCSESNSGTNNLILLVDTGANNSIIKAHSLNNQTVFYDSEKLTIKGIDVKTEYTKTCGFTFLNFNVSDNKFTNKFHVINTPSNIPYDGLLGSDFLKSYNVQINYSNNQMTLQKRSNSFSIPIHKINNEQYTLSPRSETLVEIQINNPEIKEGIIPEMEILDGVYLSRAITTVNSNSKAYASILNTLEKEVTIQESKLSLLPLPNESYIFEINESHTVNRNDLLQKSLRTDHLNLEEEESLLKICYQFNKLFYLEGDKLTSTKLIQHEINTNNSAPIVSKTYRYPEIHKEEVNKQIEKMLKENIIRPSYSPWSSPLWVVPKKLDSSGKKKWRVVIDYRKLNDVTIGDSFPLPNITEILDQLGKSKYFTTLDLYAGFHQIEVKPEDRPKTAFSTPLGLFEFNRMPFGLKNSPATFQRLMNSVLAGIVGLHCFVYMDDIVIYASSLKDHEKKLFSIFQRLESNNLTLQPDKCEFLRKEVAYLGHIVSEEGLKPNPDKVKVITNFPRPQNVKQIKQFLGLAGYYRRFIENFARISKPLTTLLQDNVDFQWTFDQEESFTILKNKLVSDPILQYPDFQKDFIVTTDASGYAISGILSQGEIGKDLPISYTSRNLKNAEINYSTTERELLAIVYAISYFRPYIYGRKFKIVTDHRPLVWLFNCKDPGSRLVRWRLKIEEYDYEIIYKPGRAISNVDCLSRIDTSHINSVSLTKTDTYEDYLKFSNSSSNVKMFDFSEEDSNLLDSKNNIAYLTGQDLDEKNKFCDQMLLSSQNKEQVQIHPNELFSIYKSKNTKFDKYIYHCFVKQYWWEKPTNQELFVTMSNLKNQLVKDEIDSISFPNFGDSINGFNVGIVQNMIHFLFRNIKIKIIIHNNKIVIPNSDDIPIILKENHDDPHSGHSGFHRTYKRVKLQYKWPNMKTDIAKYIKTCESCQRNKTVRKTYKAPMEITTTSVQPLEKLFVDVVGPLPITEEGNRFIVTMQDDLTKFSQAYATPNHEANTVAKVLLKFISHYGIPKAVMSDQGTDFLSNLMKDFSKLFHMKHIQTTGYHPQSQGQLERSHSTLKDYLKHYINCQQTDWDSWLPTAIFSYNTAIHATTKYSPYELMFGFKPTLPSSITQTPEFRYTYDNYMDQLKFRLNKSQEIARANIIKSKETSKINYDQKIVNPDYKVGDKIYLQNTRNRLCKKLSPNYNGPYEIVKVHDRQNVSIKVKRKEIKIHKNRIKPAN